MRISDWSSDVCSSDLTDPGTRFMMLSAIVRMKCPGTTAKIGEYTRKEYEEVTEELAAALLIDSPLTIAAMCSEWTREGGSLNSLMEEHRTFDYGAVNLPVRVLFSHFLSFMRDKQIGRASCRERVCQ